MLRILITVAGKCLTGKYEIVFGIKEIHEKFLYFSVGHYRKGRSRYQIQRGEKLKKTLFNKNSIFKAVKC